MQHQGRRWRAWRSHSQCRQTHSSRTLCPRRWPRAACSRADCAQCSRCRSARCWCRRMRCSGRPAARLHSRQSPGRMRPPGQASAPRSKSDRQTRVCRHRGTGRVHIQCQTTRRQPGNASRCLRVSAWRMHNSWLVSFRAPQRACWWALSQPGCLHTACTQAPTSRESIRGCSSSASILHILPVCRVPRCCP